MSLRDWCQALCSGMGEPARPPTADDLARKVEHLTSEIEGLGKRVAYVNARSAALEFTCELLAAQVKALDKRLSEQQRPQP